MPISKDFQFSYISLYAHEEHFLNYYVIETSWTCSNKSYVSIFLCKKIKQTYPTKQYTNLHICIRLFWAIFIRITSFHDNCPPLNWPIYVF